MFNQHYEALMQELSTLDAKEKEIKERKALVRDQIKKLLTDQEMSEYTYQGYKATVVETRRTMYIKKKLIEKFGEKELESCKITTPMQILRVSYQDDSNKYGKRKDQSE